MNVFENVSKNQSDIVYVDFFCKACQESHLVAIDSELFNTKTYPIDYAYIHGNPVVVATLYIDANRKVRGVEFASDFGIGQDELGKILENCKNLVLTSIPDDMIFGFELSYKKKPIKMYFDQKHINSINLEEVSKLWKFSQKITKKKEELNQFFLKFTDFWIAGLEFAEHFFIIIVDASVDIDHLKTQMMAIFETLMSSQ